jgi:hypothetical protein
MTRHLILLVPLAAVALAGTACTGTSDGIAAPAHSTATDDHGPTDSLSIDPCSLLDPAEDLQQYGNFTPRQESSEEMSDAETCSWQLQKQDPLDDGLVVGVGVRARQDIASVTDVGGGVNRGEINGREAAEAPDPNLGGCTLAIALSEDSRVDITAVAEEVNAACDVAREVAYLVEPRLPET